MQVGKRFLYMTCFIMLMLIIVPSAAFAETVSDTPAQPGRIVNCAEDLNRELGGEHMVSGNEVTLQRDVALAHTVRIQSAEPLTLNLNHKTISYEKSRPQDWNIPTGVFALSSHLTVDGDGTVQTTKDNVSAIVMLDGSLTVDNAVIKTSGNEAPVISVESLDSSLSTIQINDGRLQSKDRAVLSWHRSSVNMEVNGGTIDGTVWLDSPHDNKNILQINGGTVKHLYLESTSCTMNGGKILQGLEAQRSEIGFNGGTVSGKGADLEDAKLTMKGGTISSSDAQALKLTSYLYDEKKSDTAIIIGGTISTSKTGAKGIEVIGKEKKQYTGIRISGGTIKSTAKKKTGSGIYAIGKNAKVTLQGTKGKSAYIRNYKFGMYHEGIYDDPPPTMAIGNYTKVYAPETKKGAYVKGSKLPKRVWGNVSIKYSK